MAVFGGATTSAATLVTSITTAGAGRYQLAVAAAGRSPRPDKTEPVRAVAEAVPASMSLPVPASVWVDIVKCESGGRWNINTGNGYRGGLQFKPSTWRSFGGTKYAPTADKATKPNRSRLRRRSAPARLGPPGRVQGPEADTARREAPGRLGDAALHDPSQGW